MKAGPRVWGVLSIGVIAAVLATVGASYHRGSGFTWLIEFPANAHEWEVPRVREAPHFDHPDSPGYDGQFYAQMATDPLLRDQAIDRSVDTVAYRAKRILLSWIAFALGLGKPAWILQAYALLNVISWLLLAWVLCQWMRPTSGRMFALWAATLLSHGMLSSMRYALTDGPSALLIALAVLALERARPVIAALVLGAAGLARETNLLAAAMFARVIERRPGSWLKGAIYLLLSALPLLLWLDYLRSIYRSAVLTGGGHITLPFSGMAWKVNWLLSALSTHGVTMDVAMSAMAMFGFAVQTGYVLWRLRKAGRAAPPWLLVGASFVVLACVMHRVVWTGSPGAFTRVIVPLTVAVNALLAGEDRPYWPIIVGANLAAVPGVFVAFGRG